MLWSVTAWSNAGSPAAFPDGTRGPKPTPSTVGVCNSGNNIDVESSGGSSLAGYATLKAAFDSINAGTHTGTVIVEICGDTSETASAIINASGTGSALYSSVDVRAVGGPRQITGALNTALVKLNGADNVTIDGRIDGIGRNLSVINSGTNTPCGGIWLSSLGTDLGATNNVIRNLEIACGIDQTAGNNLSFGIIMSGTGMVVGDDGRDNDNNSFIENRIIKARYGIVTRGAANNLNVSPVVKDNIVGPNAFGSDQIGKVGIFMQADSGATVSGNTVQFVGCLEPQTCSGADRFGIAIGNESWSLTPGTLTGNQYHVAGNTVHDVVDELAGSAVGINLATTSTGSPTSNTVANNFVHSIHSNGLTNDQTVGIGITGGHTDKVVYNSIALTGDVDPGVAAAAGMYGSGIRVANISSSNHANLLVKNNSIYIDLSSSSTSGVRFYAISGNNSAYSFGTGGQDHNNLYINPLNPQVQTGGLGSLSGNSLTAQYATLADWRTAYVTPQDANSIQADPLYTAVNSDLHLMGVSPNVGTGTQVIGVTDDVDGDVRDVTTPDIGADEFVIASPEMNVTGNAQSIANGDLTPDTADHTDFETAAVSSGTVIRTFTIANAGDSDLALSGIPKVVVSGTNASDFSITSDPASSVGASSSTTFQVTFDPSDNGFRTAQISIDNNDADENPYTFAIRGTGESTFTLTLEKSGAGSGSVTSSPAGIDCGIDCSEDYAGSTEVTLTATSDAGSTFDGWSGGACSGTGTCVVTMDAAKTVTADFGVEALPATTIQFAAAGFEGPEGTLVTVNATRTGDLSGASSINYQTEAGGTGTGGTCGDPGVDYEPASGNLLFDADEASETFTVRLCSDFMSENPAETVLLSLSNPTGATLGTKDAAGVGIIDVARQYANFDTIAVPVDTASSTQSSLTVLGYDGPAGGVRVTLFDVTIADPENVDIMLVSPAGKQFVLMADVGGSNPLFESIITLEDAAPDSLPDNTAITQFRNYKPTNCVVPVADFPAPAPGGPYAEPGCGVQPALAEGVPVATLNGVFGPDNPNGEWTLYVRRDSTVVPLAEGSLDSVGGFGIQFIAPTAAGVSLGGRVTTSAGAGIRNVYVRLIDGSGEQRQALTNSFGYYSFDDLAAGQTYIVSLSAKRYRFANPTRVITLNDNLDSVDFTADP
jgi:hypothetical protein